MKPFLVTLLVSVTLASSGLAFEVPVHRRLTETAVEHSSVDEFLIGELGIQSGTAELWDGVTIRDRIINGSKSEDDSGRFCNHFHDPSDSWNEAGLSLAKCPLSFQNPSSLQWAQSSDNDYSWDSVREAYYKWLTSTDNKTREMWGSMFFRGIGQQVHLVQDAGVPAHARRDAHPVFDPFEHWTAQILAEDPMEFDNLATPAAESTELTALFERWTVDPLLQPVATLIDSVREAGALTPSDGFDVGLAEFSNGNFSSDDTWRNYSFPRPQSLGSLFAMGGFFYFPKLSE